jgi:glucose/arabinose dehydrogenase
MTAALHRPARGARGIFASALVCWSLAACAGASPTPHPSSAAASSSSAASAVASPVQTATSSPTPEPPPPTGPDRLRLELVADGLSEPIGITAAHDGSGRLFVNERAGRIRVIGPGGNLRGDPFIDLSPRVLAGNERGLLGLAFHPGFASNRRLFVHYSRAGDGATVVSELRASADLASADPGSERILLTRTQPFANHNGGQLAFGPDGYLYIGLGDGGSGGDPFGNAQNPDVLLGKILRIDVDGEPDGRRAYALPPDNPFGPDGAEPGAGQPEIWALGLRNPWRFSFDPEGGDLYIGDVGQNAYEEIDRQPGDSDGGENYGWDVMEGRHCYAGDCDQAGYVKPIAEYDHDLGSCSVTGGYVYRGTAQAALRGTYVFADYCSGIVFTLQVDQGTVTPKQVLSSNLNVSSFGTDEDGEMYLADLAGGGIYRVLVGD